MPTYFFHFSGVVLMTADVVRAARVNANDTPRAIDVNNLPGEDDQRSRAEIAARIPAIEDLDEFAMDPPGEWLADRTWADGTI